MTELENCLSTRVLIVGGGPAGLTAAIYAARANLEPVVAAGGFLGGSSVPGGQLMITTDVENFPGFPEGVLGPELMDRMRQQAERFGANIIDEFATDFCFNPEGPHRVTVGDQVFEAQAVILAMGAQAKWLGAEGEERYVNRGISACATCDGPLPMFRNQRIVVVGGGDSACEEAAFLARFASEVVMVVRRDELRASKIMAKRVLEHEKIKIRWNTNVVGYYGDEDRLRGVRLSVKGRDATEELDCSGVFMAIGHEPSTREVAGSGLELDEKGYVVARDGVQTNLRGVFTAGDVHDQHYRQAVTAAGFGCMAAISCERWLNAVDN
jgi:thioredoxin reductase (NADPH)